jgi:hypothetical protein
MNTRGKPLGWLPANAARWTIAAVGRYEAANSHSTMPAKRWLCGRRETTNDLDIEWQSVHGVELGLLGEP